MATPLKHIIQSFLKSKQKQFRLQESIEQATHRLLDEEVKKHIRFAGIYKKTAVFHAESSVWVYELNLKRNVLLAAIKKEAPGVERITIKVRKV